jgi:hypothetical protein
VEKRIHGGKISELEVATECIKAGLSVYLPLVDDETVDMVGPPVRWQTLRHTSKELCRPQPDNRSTVAVCLGRRSRQLHTRRRLPFSRGSI